VIAFGSELRGDDGAGAEVARRLASPLPPGCEIRSVHQLTPELAETVAAACRVCFVDAREPDGDSEVRVEPLRPEAPAIDLGHHLSPTALLAIADALFGRAPEAWLVTIPSESFELGRGLSPTAARGVQYAAGLIRDVLRRHGATQDA
jgi:hydrogenase maturation protease